MIPAPDTQKSHPWRSSRAVLARDGPAQESSVATAIRRHRFGWMLGLPQQTICVSQRATVRFRLPRA
jgi:hypothetical protein